MQQLLVPALHMKRVRCPAGAWGCRCILPQADLPEGRVHRAVHTALLHNLTKARVLTAQSTVIAMGRPGADILGCDRRALHGSPP